MTEKKLILIVDDEEEIIQLLKDFLERKNFRLITATDGAQALDLAKKHIPDLIITDMLLPKIHGVEVTQLIKDNFFIPVIGISGIYKKGEVGQDMEDYYLDGFFEKPINLEELLKCINSILYE